MVIYFRTRKLEKILDHEREMVKHLGQKGAEKGKRRMVELKAAGALSDITHLPPARCHQLTGKEPGIFSVDLEHPYRLLFIPADDPTPRREDGGIDTTKIKEVEIIEIRDTH